MTLRHIRDWIQERNTLVQETRTAHEGAGADTTKLAEIEEAQEKRRSKFFELGGKIQNGIQELEVEAMAREQEETAERLVRLNDRIDRPSPGGPGSMLPPERLSERPAWWSHFLSGGAERVRHQLADNAAGLEEFAQSISDGPTGGWAVPTVVTSGISRVYPTWTIESVVREVVLNGFSAVSMRAILGYGMEKAPYLASGQPAPQRDLSTERRVLEAVRQAAVCTYDRPLADTMANFPSELESEAAMQFSRGTEDYIMNGGDPPGPAGVFTTGDDGIPTGNDVAGNNTGTAVKDEAWWDAFFGLKSGARMSPALRWVMHRNAISKVMQVKDTNGQYIFHPVRMFQEGASDTVVGVRIVESEEAPHTFTSGKYIAILGDWHQYVMIRWGGGTPIAIDITQTEATSGRVGVVFERYNNGAVINSDAFQRVKMG